MIICTNEDKTFDFNEKYELSLIVLLKSNGFVFAVLDHIHLRYICLNEYKTDDSIDIIEDFIKLSYSNKWLLLNFKKVKIVFESSHFIFHPEKMLSTPSGTELTMDNFFSNTSNAFQIVKQLDQKVAIQFELDPAIKSKLNLRFENCFFGHISESFFKYHIQYIAKTGKHHYQLYRGQDFLMVLITKDSQIVLFNSLPCKSDSDLIYYFTLLQKNYTGSEIGISGDFDTEGDLVKKLSIKFNIKPISFSMDYQYMFSINRLNQSLYSTFINQPLCE